MTNDKVPPYYNSLYARVYTEAMLTGFGMIGLLGILMRLKKLDDE